jgi:hypothetical protein
VYTHHSTKRQSVHLLVTDCDSTNVTAVVHPAVILRLSSSKGNFFQPISQCLTVRHSMSLVSSSGCSKIKKTRRLDLTAASSNLRGTWHVPSVTAPYFIRASLIIQGHSYPCHSISSVPVPSVRQWVGKVKWFNEQFLLKFPDVSTTNETNAKL